MSTITMASRTESPTTEPSGTEPSGTTGGTLTRLTAPTMTVPRLTGPLLAAVRVIAAALFLCHGLQGLVGLFGGIDGHGTAVPLLSWPGGIGSLIETVCAVLIGVGLFTRVAALLCSGCMAYAYFFIHLPLGLGPVPLVNGGEQAVLFCWLFLLFAVVGPGSFALDGLLRRRRRTA